MIVVAAASGYVSVACCSRYLPHGNAGGDACTAPHKEMIKLFDLAPAPAAVPASRDNVRVRRYPKEDALQAPDVRSWRAAVVRRL